jgi:hypothetical protein
MPGKSERRWAVTLGFAVMLLMTLPYLVGYASQGKNWHYTGLLIAAEDGQSYFAKMLLGANGDWLFKTPYTLTPQNGFLAFLPYLILGKLTSPPGQSEQMAGLFHILRFSGGILAALATYDFVSLYIQKIRWRRWATFFALVGGGFGGLALLGLPLWRGPMPLEFYSPESFGFLALLSLPHLTWARALLLWGLRRFLISKNWRDALPAGLLWLGMGFFQPLTVVVGWAILGAQAAVGALWTWLKRENGWSEWFAWVKRALLVGLVSSPVVLYTLVSFRLDGFLRQWQTQNYLPSPAVTDYLLAYGLALPLVVLGLVQLRGKADRQTLLLIGWLGVIPILVYLPYNLQRRLAEGIWAALCILAFIGLDRITTPLQKWGIVWLGLGLLPAISLLAGGVMSVSSPGLPLFRSVGELQAFEYLAKNAQKGDAVLAAYDTSTVLPAHAPVRVPIGHGPESLGGHELQPRVERFYQSGTPDSERRELLVELTIRYVFYGPLERKLGDWDPGPAAFLAEVYRGGDYAIYRVERGK